MNFLKVVIKGLVFNKIDEFRRKTLKYRKCEIFDSLKNKVKRLHETLGKFTKGKENLDLILFNQRASYNKGGLGYQPNKPFISIFMLRRRPIDSCLNAIIDISLVI